MSYLKMLESRLNFIEEDGSTLVETLVAMAILVSVLLPTSLFFGYIASNPLNEDKITALGLAQNEMEKSLTNKKFGDNQREVSDRWIIKRISTKEGDLVHIEIQVYRKGDPEPGITLNTERLDYEN